MLQAMGPLDEKLIVQEDPLDQNGELQDLNYLTEVRGNNKQR